MRYRYLYLDQIVEMIEGSTDPVIKMAVLWANHDQPNVKALVQILYDYRINFEIGGVPKYRRNRNGGMEFGQAVILLSNKINQRSIGAPTKFKFLIDVLEKLQDRDSEVLIRALRHKIKFRIPLEDIQRVYPDIKAGPNFSLKAAKADLASLEFPGRILKQPQGHEMRVVINEHGNFKFVDIDGNGLILPDKPNSAFHEIFKGIRNVTLSCTFHGLTKDKSKIGNTATGNSAYAKFSEGKLTDETIAITILDAVDNWSYHNWPEDHPRVAMTFEQRHEWVTRQDWPESIHVRVAEDVVVESLEDMRSLENEVLASKDILRYYSNNATWSDGFTLLSKECF